MLHLVRSTAKKKYVLFISNLTEILNEETLLPLILLSPIDHGFLYKGTQDRQVYKILG
jgi:hypothetical protein